MDKFGRVATKSVGDIVEIVRGLPGACPPRQWKNLNDAVVAALERSLTGNSTGGAETGAASSKSMVGGKTCRQSS